jgi:peptide deformylase
VNAEATPETVAGMPDWTPSGPGTVRPAVLAPDGVLSRPCAEVDPRDPEIEALAADLVATMRANAGCVGLAANQIGVAARLFVLDVGGHPKTRTSHGLFALCNAEVVAASRWQKAREGCLSVPAFTGDVKRAGLLTVRGVPPGRSEPVELTTDAFEARALQHEIDHTDGYLFLDRVAGAHAVHPRRTFL